MPVATSPPDDLFLAFQAAVAGRYSLERELGRGGMGVVYLAREVRLDRPVAIKVLPPARAADAALRERFLREARTAAKLSHPNIVPIHAVDEVGEFVFFAMAHVAGDTLTARVGTRGPVPPSDAARILREVAWALAYAHAQGVIHRDVKPDNILLETGSGRALVTDFGIAAVVRDAAGLDGGEVLGTPQFMSPEQALGERVDARSDLYALGLVGYFALTGRVAYDSAKASETLAKQVAAPPPSLDGAGFPRKLAHAIHRCLVKDPGERPQTGEELAETLTLALEQRREIPVALRVFIKRYARITGLGAFAYLWALMVVTAGLGAGFGQLAGMGTLLGGLTVGPLAILVARARRLLGSGFGPDDLDLAFRTELAQGREERVFEWGLGPSTYERVVRIISAAGLGVASVTAVGLAAAGGPAPAWAYLVLGCSTTIGGGCAVLAALRLQLRRDLGTELWARLWKGRFGRGIFALAARLRPASPIGPAPTHRPTELALGLAAEKLFEDLPRDARRRLGDLPGVLRRLEDDARRMRRRLDELTDALGERGSGSAERGAPTDSSALRAPSSAFEDRRDRIAADLRAERDAVQRRLGDAVAALEAIRLNLLRLHAGAATVQSLTTDLGLAREVSAEIDLLLAGQREADGILGRGPSTDDPIRA